MGRLEIHQLSCDVLLGDVQVVYPLAVAELWMELAGLGIDEVSSERARIATKERVGKGAVAPIKAAQVQANEQPDQGVHEAVSEVRHSPARKQVAVRERELEVASDQDSVELLGGGGRRLPPSSRAIGDDADPLHGRHPCLTELTKEPVLSLGQPLGQLLQGVQDPLVVHESNHVACDAPRDLDQPIGLPRFQRDPPRKVQEVGMPSRSRHLKAHEAHCLPRQPGPVEPRLSARRF